MRTYKAIIVPTVSGGNIEVRVSANSVSQAAGIIQTLPYFKSFVRQPMQEDKEQNNLTKITDLVKMAQRKDQAELGSMDQCGYWSVDTKCYNRFMKNNSYEQINKTEIELWQIEAIKRGLKDIDSGRVVSIEEVKDMWVLN